MRNQNRRLSVEACWRPVRRGVFAGVDTGLVRWIRDDSSLTHRVINACRGSFSVHVQGQYRARPLPSERRLLGTPVAEKMLIREVQLRCDHEAWVFARTLIPAATLRGRARRLARLGDRPLGALLFADPATERRRVEVGRLVPRHPLFAHAARHLDHRPRALWGRRTLFVYAGRPLLVNEIFLPGVPPAR